jgi:hypothetical protein
MVEIEHTQDQIESSGFERQQLRLGNQTRGWRSSRKATGRVHLHESFDATAVVQQTDEDAATATKIERDRKLALDIIKTVGKALGHVRDQKICLAPVPRRPLAEAT